MTAVTLQRTIPGLAASAAAPVGPSGLSSIGPATTKTTTTSEPDVICTDAGVRLGVEPDLMRVRAKAKRTLHHPRPVRRRRSYWSGTTLDAFASTKSLKA